MREEKEVKYYTVNDSKHKFESLKAAQLAYMGFCGGEIIIVEHTEKRFKHKIDENIYNIMLDDRREFAHTVLSKLTKGMENHNVCDMHICTSILWVIKIWAVYTKEQLMEPMHWSDAMSLFNTKYKYEMASILKEFLIAVMDKYPLENAKIKEFHTRTKPYNGIIILFDDIKKAFPNIFIKNKFKSNDKIENLFENKSLSIIFRGDGKYKNIVITTTLEAYNPRVKGTYTQVDINSEKVIDYFNSVIENKC